MKKTNFKAGGRAALIGSLPLNDYREALDWIFSCCPDLPIWPQLPISPQQGMLNQFIEGLACVSEVDNRTFFKTDTTEFEAEQLKFYEEYLQVTENPKALFTSRFKTSEERAAGIYELAKAARAKKDLVGIKGQITGPFTLLTGLKDENDRLGYYDPATRDLVVKGLAMMAAWQVKFFKKELGDDLPVLLFIDEPALAGLGSSAFISISLNDIGQDLAEVIDAINLAGGLAGVHVCANTDWNLLLDSNVDIISFDAYGFFDRFITCRTKIDAFLDRGGIIAWGLVPTSEPEHITGETTESLVELWEKQAAQLTSPNRDEKGLLDQTLITPSCGTGSLAPDLARRVLDLTSSVATALRKKYC